MRTFVRIGFVAFFGSKTFGQSADTSLKPAFDLADVHASARTTSSNPFMSGGVLRGGRYDLRNATMVDLIKTAWNVDADTVLGGPNWLEIDRFDVTAKAPAKTTPETIRLMLQRLLADRFKLEIHQDTKPPPGFTLTRQR